MILTSQQRKILEKAAINIQPVVIIGQNGITSALTKKVSASLFSHELIKLKFNEFKEQKQTLTDKIVNDCDATLVRIIGNIAILYKEAEKPEDRRFKL